MIRKTFFALAALALCSTAAWADGAEDGTAGQASLNAGSFDKAIAQFTSAIRADDLSYEDLEFAYYNRGIAYLWKRDYADAYADFKVATRIQPSDLYAIGYLRYTEDFLNHKPPPPPTDIINQLVSSALGLFFSPLLRAQTVKGWQDIDPWTQKCLTFRYGIDPMDMALTKAQGPDVPLLDDYFAACEPVVNQEVAQAKAAFQKAAPVAKGKKKRG